MHSALSAPPPRLELVRSQLARLELPLHVRVQRLRLVLAESGIHL